MEEKDIRKNFSENITKLRKSKQLSQSSLAEKLNYSDKAISKWENGDTIPDIISMHEIANFFNITIDDLISASDVVKKSNKKRNHILITISSFFLCFLIATITYFILKLCGINKAYYSYIIVPIPASIVLVVFTKLWFKSLYVLISVSLLICSCAMLIMCLLHFSYFWIAIIIAFILIVLFAFLLKINNHNYLN